MRLWFFLLFITGWSVSAAADVVVPVRTIRAGELINTTDLALAPGTIADGVTELAMLDGLQALRPLYVNRPIRAQDVGPQSIIARNDEATAVYMVGGLRISARVRALGEAGVGETVRVMNLSSRQIVQGIVGVDGTIFVSNEMGAE